MSDSNIRVRPVQIIALVGLYQAFGLSPLGYHVCNALLLLATALLLFTVLLELKKPLLIATSVSAVFILLPHYSTDRFWISAMQANLSILFYLASFYCMLRTAKSSLPWVFLFLSALCAAISALSYEVAVPLFVLNALYVLWIGKLNPKARFTTGITFAALAACFIFKLWINQRPVMHPGTFWSHAMFLAHQSLFVNFFQLGIAYPRVVFKLIYYHFDLLSLGAAVIIGLLVFLSLQQSVQQEPESVSRISWPRVMLLGLTTFGLGYAIFLTTDQVSFHKTGVANRTSIAASLGTALCFIGVIGYVSGRLTPRFRALCFSVFVALLCASGALVNITLSKYWIRSYEQEQTAIHKITAHRVSIPYGSAILVDGVCPYIGPAPVLESWWENSGVAQLAFARPDLVGDAISTRIHLNPNSLTTVIYDQSRSYRYGGRFVLYDVPLDRFFVIHNSTEMNNYFRDYGSFSTLNMKCSGMPGEGISVF